MDEPGRNFTTTMAARYKIVVFSEMSGILYALLLGLLVSCRSSGSSKRGEGWTKAALQTHTCREHRRLHGLEQEVF